MTITKVEVLAMDFPAIMAAVKNPETSIAMQGLLKDRQVATYVSEKMLQHKQALEAREATANVIAGTIPPSTEELAAEANAMVEETETVTEVPVVAPLVVDTVAEDTEYRESGITPYRDASGKIYKLVQEYQVRDDDGTAIGRATHLEAKNALELLGKQRKAHEEAVRFGYRMKKQKLQFKSDQPKSLLTADQIQEAARIALGEKDENKAADVVREIIRSDFEKREIELRNKTAHENGRAIMNEFRARHFHDYQPCEANRLALKEYFDDNSDIEFTLDALEFAFADLLQRGKLVPVTRQGTTQAVAEPNPPVAASVAAPAAAITAPPVAAAETVTAVNAEVPPSQAASIATVATPASAANVPPPARRPAVNGGLPPGSLSAQRPGQADPAQTRKEFLKTVRDMDPEVMKKKLKTDPQFVKNLRLAGVRV